MRVYPDFSAPYVPDPPRWVRWVLIPAAIVAIGVLALLVFGGCAHRRECSVPNPAPPVTAASSEWRVIGPCDPEFEDCPGGLCEVVDPPRPSPLDVVVTHAPERPSEPRADVAALPTAPASSMPRGAQLGLALFAACAAFGFRRLLAGAS